MDSDNEDRFNSGWSRRNFLKTIGVVGLGATAMGLAACNPSSGEASKNEGDTGTLTPTKTMSADVVVCGTGTTGICAIERAAELGAKVIGLEKNAGIGGTSYFAEGVAGIGSKVALAQGIKEDVDDIFTRAQDFHHWAADGPVLHKFLEASGATIDWLADLGVPFGPVMNTASGDAALLAPNVWHLVLGRVGPGLIDPLLAKATDLGAEVLYETSAKSLLVDKGKVTGVVATSADGEVIQINAPVVIFASGGFSNNPEMMRKYVMVDPDKIHEWGVPGRTGDALNMGIANNASLHLPGASNFFAAMIEGTTNFYDKINLGSAWQPSLYVNGEGTRFHNEGICFDFTTQSNAFGTQLEVYSILDSSYVEMMATVGCSNYNPVVLYYQTEKLEGLKEELEASKQVMVGETIEDLAEKLGLDPAKLKSTLDRYNGYCKAGIDEEFSKPAKFLQAMNIPPFYGSKLIRTNLGTCGGLRVNEYMQVTTNEGGIIEGLYAGGGDAGGVYGYNYDVAVISGSQQGWAATSGKLAAEHAVQVYLKA